MKNIRRFLSIILAVMMVMTAFSPFQVLAANDDELVPFINYLNYNKRDQHDIYTTFNSEFKQTVYTKSTNCFMFFNDIGFTRVEHIENNTEKDKQYCLIEEYNENNILVARKIIKDELVDFCGFYHGDNYNFFLYSQDNNEQNDNKEVLRVVKYSYDWKRLGDSRILGATFKSENLIRRPVQSVNPAFEEYNDKLFIRTSYVRYDTHQQNLTIVINENSMEANCLLRGTFASHSWKQLVTKNDNKLLFVDLCDGNPWRGILTFLYDAEKMSKVYTTDNTRNVFAFNGEIGYNGTGSSLCDASSSDSKYFVLFTSVEQDDLWNMSNHNPRNIYLSVINENMQNAYYSSKKITNYPRDNSCDVLVLNPHILKFNNNQFMAIWTKYTTFNDAPDKSKSKMYYFTFNGNGEMTSEICELNGKASNCKPVIKDEIAYWYVTDDTGFSICSIDADANYKEEYIVEFTGEFSISSDYTAGLKAKYNGKELTYNIIDAFLSNEKFYAYHKFLNDELKKLNGWQEINNKYYYFTNGVKNTGWLQSNNQWYYLGSDGAMRIGWQTIDKKKYYFKSSGEMVKWTNNINGKQYYFNGYGQMMTGLIKFGDIYKFFDSNGAAVKNCWKTISGKTYYFGNDYTSVKWRKWINGKLYYFNGACVLQKNGWIRGGNWFYANKDGTLKTGWLKYNNRWYYMNGSGDMVTGWKWVSGCKYYFNSYGAMLTGWQKISGKWYYFNASGSMRTANLKQGRKVYRFDNNGVCQNPYI